MRLILLLALLFVSCTSPQQDYNLTAQDEERFAAEYSLHTWRVEQHEDGRVSMVYAWKPHAYTPRYGMKVIYPSWLHAQDRMAVLKAIDYCAHVMVREYPWLEDGYDFSDLTVFVHDSTDRCMSGPPPRWCLGWRYRHFIVVCWRTESRQLVAESNILPALSHEIFHDVFGEQYGDSDTNHDKYFPGVGGVITICRKDVLHVPLSTESQQQAMAYSYLPWCIPGYRLYSFKAPLSKLLR